MYHKPVRSSLLIESMKEIKCSGAFLLLITLFSLLTSCKNEAGKKTEDSSVNAALEKLMDDYYKERMALFPLEATANGDTLYNDKLYASFTDSYE